MQLADVKDDALFVVDTDRGTSATPPTLTPKRVDRAAAKVKKTRAQLILEQMNAGIKEIATECDKKRQKKAHVPIHQHHARAFRLDAGAPSTSAPSSRDQKNNQRTTLTHRGTVADVWADAAPDTVRVRARKGIGTKLRPAIAAVEVDSAGCSYHPTYDDHQDALAVAVAHEVRKELREVLHPKHAPRVSHHGPANAAADDDGLLVDLPDEDDTDEEEEVPCSSIRTARPKSQADRNRVARRKAAEKEQREKEATKQLRRDIEQARDIDEHLAEEAARQALMAERREALRRDRETREPPRMGRTRFEDLPVQILATDQINGSLRKVKAFPALAMERMKSFQKRGMVEVTKRQRLRTGKRITYVTGARSERGREEQAEIWALQEKNRRTRHKLATGNQLLD